jgi:hypothetical protein
MNRDLPRRKARAIAISASAEANRKMLAVKAMGILALAFGVFEAAWTVHHVLMAR